MTLQIHFLYGYKATIFCLPLQTIVLKIEYKDCGGKQKMVTMYCCIVASASNVVDVKKNF